MHEPVDDYPPPRRLAALEIEGVKMEQNVCYLDDTWEIENFHEVQLERVGPNMWVPTKQILVWGQFRLRLSWMYGLGHIIDASFAPDLRSFTAGELGCAGV
jgi:hypothetical protein